MAFWLMVLSGLFLFKKDNEYCGIKVPMQHHPQPWAPNDVKNLHLAVTSLKPWMNEEGRV